ncbi:uncharacterized protein LOC131958339 [Physella acuta]|uniref:uncharacterized protein LOC131958339 n=1 Tax=Physella acuta TaxID=109671 RepID=UPI0027DBC40E|nr:uncharacterized protein LOC131958339 [Physella acuta]
MTSKAGRDHYENSPKQSTGTSLASTSLSTIPNRSNGIVREKTITRAASAKYYDIANTILGGSGDVEEAFITAAKNGNFNKAEQLIKQRNIGLDIDCKDKRTGNTALIWAARRGHVKIIELLLKNGADTTLCNHESQTAVEVAAPSVRTVLLDWVETHKELNEKLLLQAAWQGNLSVISEILSSNSRNLNINCRNAEGFTPLMLVARDMQLFERLSVQLNRYYSPVQVAEELIKAKADIHITDHDGRSSLHYASQSHANCADQMVNVLISKGMDFELRDKKLFTPIHLAAQQGNTNTVAALADSGSNVNVKGFAGWTPLHVSSYNNHQQTVSALLGYGADIAITDDQGLTPIEVARTKKMKNLLKEAWTESNRTNNNEITNGSSEEVKKKGGNPIKKKPEVIFDGLVNAQSNPPTAKPSKTKVLNTVERCKQAEKKILQEVEALKAAHPVLSRESTRMLGTSRSKILPQIGRSSSPEAASGRVKQAAGQASISPRSTLEEARKQLMSRGRSVSDIKLGLGRQSSMSGTSGVSEDFYGSRLLSRFSPPTATTGHRRSDSDPSTHSMRDLAESCDTILPNSKGQRQVLTSKAVSSSNRVSPTSQFFITQKSSVFDKKFSPEDDVFSSVEIPFEMPQCRSIFKDEFVLEESRPKDSISGSSSSLSSPSPRDSSTFQPLRPHRLNGSLTTLVEQQASTDFTPVDLRASLEGGVKPLIKNPKQRIRHRSENSLSSSLDSETENESRNNTFLSRASSFKQPKTPGNETSSSFELQSKSHSLENVPSKLATRSTPPPIITKTSPKPHSFSNEDLTLPHLKTDQPNPIHLSETKALAPDKACQTKPDKPAVKNLDTVEPFSGKARILPSFSFDNWDILSKQNQDATAEHINTGISVSKSMSSVLIHGSSEPTDLHSSSSVYVKKSGSQQALDPSLTERKSVRVSKEEKNASNVHVHKDNPERPVSNQNHIRRQPEKKVEDKSMNPQQKISQPNTSNTKTKIENCASNTKQTLVKKVVCVEKTITHLNVSNSPKPKSSSRSTEDVVNGSGDVKCSSTASSRQSVTSVKKTPTKSQNFTPSKPTEASNKNATGQVSDTAGQVQHNLVANATTKEVLPTNQFLTANSPHKAKSTIPHSKESITTPLIVNPYEEFDQPHITLIKNPPQDAVVKLKKSSVTKTKKVSSSKRPTSGSSRQSSAGKKSRTKGKDPKPEAESRPRSGKRKSKQAKQKAQEEPDLSEIASKPDTVLISGIGWQLSTSCSDAAQIQISKKINIEANDTDDIDSGDEGQRSSKLNHLESSRFLEIAKDKIAECSPRFLEMKRQESLLDVKLPFAENDGFPPMNLDMTQKTSSYEELGHSDQDSSIRTRKEQKIYQENFICDLTPIPEASYLSKTADAISAFDKGFHGSKLSLLLDAEDPSFKNGFQSYNSIKRIHSPVPPAAVPEPANPKNLHQSPKKNQDSKMSSRSEKKFSEVQNQHLKDKRVSDEEDIDEVIEEILSSTAPSLSSALRNMSTNFSSGAHTLTYGDRRLLASLTSSHFKSPFHANIPSPEEKAKLDEPIEDLSTARSQKSSSAYPQFSSASHQSPSTNETTSAHQSPSSPHESISSPGSMVLQEESLAPGTKKHQEVPESSIRSKPPSTLTKEEMAPRQAKLGRSSSTREARRRNRELVVNEEEAKHLAKVINSFKHMELQATAERPDGQQTSMRSPHRASKSSLTVGDLSFVSRPNSTNTSFRSKGRFRELKENVGSSVGKLSANSQVSEEISVQEVRPSEAVELETLLQDKFSTTGTLTHPAENFYSGSARRGSLAGSECASDGIKGGEDTIQWKKGNILGKGAFGTVWCGLTNEGQLIAVKQIELNTVDRSKTQHEYEKVQEEVELLKTLEHTNIVGYLGTSLEDNIVSIFMQFVPGGSLASILARFGALDESVFRRYTKQILEGVKYLHDNDVIHRDLKGANVMLMPNGVIKLIDFGCAKRMCINLSISEAEVLKSMKGTPFWMAPEVVSETGHGKKSDIWSIGCTVFEMATRKPPWSHMNPMAAIFAIGSPNRPVPTLDEKFSQNARDFVCQCLTRDQDARPSAADLLDHPFISRKPTRRS